MKRRPWGTSLIELLVYMSLSLVLLTGFLKLFRAFRPITSETEFSYMLSQEVEERIDALRSQLTETALGAILIDSAGSPSLSFPTFRDPSGKPIFSEQGSPAWQGQVYYVLETGPGQTGNLVSWHDPTPLSVPIPASKPPLPVDPKTRHVLLSGVVLPNAKLDGLSGYTPSADGGFHCEFLRRQAASGGQYTFVGSTFSPAAVTAGRASGLNVNGNSGLIQVTLQVFQNAAATGKPNYLSISLRIRPRY